MCSPKGYTHNVRRSIHTINLTEKQLQQLTICFNVYPWIKRVNGPMKLYTSCDSNLVNVREDLFTLVSKTHGYPFSGSVLNVVFSLDWWYTCWFVFDIHTLIVFHWADRSSTELYQQLQKYPVRVSSGYRTYIYDIQLYTSSGTFSRY